RVHVLLILAGAERSHHECLRLATGEESKAMRARQHADLRHDPPNRLQIATIEALSSLQNVATDYLLREALEAICKQNGFCRMVGRKQLRKNLLADSLHHLATLLLLGYRISLAQLLLGDLLHAVLVFRLVGELDLPGLLRGGLGQLDDGLDHRLEVPV